MGRSCFDCCCSCVRRGLCSCCRLCCCLHCRRLCCRCLRSCCRWSCRPFGCRWCRFVCRGGAFARRLRLALFGGARTGRAAARAWRLWALGLCSACASWRCVCRPSPNRRTSRGRVRGGCPRSGYTPACRTTRARGGSCKGRAWPHAIRATPKPQSWEWPQRIP